MYRVLDKPISTHCTGSHIDPWSSLHSTVKTTQWQTRSTARSYKSPIHTSTKQVPPSIPEPPTDPAPGSDPAVSDKALAASICSTYQPQQSRDAFTWHDGSSQRLAFSGGYNVPLQANPFTSDMRILDCGDVPVTSYVYLATGDQKTRD